MRTTSSSLIPSIRPSRSVRVGLLLALLTLGLNASAGIPAEALGTWGPKNAPCAGRPQIQVRESQATVVTHKRKIEFRYARTTPLTAQAATEAKEIVVEFGKPLALSLRLNVEGEKGAARVEQPGIERLPGIPPEGLELRRCVASH